jgi:hypothetical protein
MSDPVAEAAANLAKQQAEPSLLDKAMDTIHDLEAKVEHLIHPESVPNVTPGSPAIDASATLLDVSGQNTETASSATPSESLSNGTQASASAIVSSEPSTSIPTSSVGSESPNVLPASTSGTALESTPSADSGLKAEVPNAALAAAESTTVTASAIHASGSGETSSIGASSAEPPLHMRVANHLEAIYSMVKAHAEAAPTAAVADTSALKTHMGDILHRISNGMQVTEGELVQKLEALYRIL